MSFVEENLKEKIQEIINNSNLDEITVNKVKARLGDIVSNSNEDQIKEIIDELLLQKILINEDAKLAKQIAEEEYNGEDLKRNVRKRRKVEIKKTKPKGSRKVSTSNPFNRPMLLSKPLSTLLDGQEMLSRPSVVKGIWAYVKENNLQDPDNKKTIICDELLQAVFKRKQVDCFKMNKFLSNHLTKTEDITESFSNIETDSRNEDKDDHTKSPVKLRRKMVCLPQKFRDAFDEEDLGYLPFHEMASKILKNIAPDCPQLIVLSERVRVALNEDRNEISLFELIERIVDCLENSNQ